MTKLLAPPVREHFRAADAAAPVRKDAALHRVKSEALFCGAAELQIEHRGSLYRLRQTSLSKLILTR